MLSNKAGFEMSYKKFVNYHRPLINITNQNLCSALTGKSTNIPFNWVLELVKQSIPKWVHACLYEPVFVASG